MSHAIAKEETLKTSNGHSKPKTKKTGSKRLVMLDPGHGGIDTGAIGRNGSQEKHVVLAIAYFAKSRNRCTRYFAKSRNRCAFNPDRGYLYSAVRSGGNRP
ncbi:N-acetylmuramoyl-L-alanine amidase [Salmonella enterica subsp. enterica serovar Montevideo str. S5-403]|uniref:N-acetylmuramoyl-L-alanine amidase n=1 Tax=Salmonella enterica subsp. enterica serovar Montevideo str. S5-403 TaxID=913242 RepID=G5Q5V7_SALMO|nr:N-acetylmuramoyl-L-alanine amidase [Salmonella enterica subsp. enterica serovar Montevideo str. S5-403]